MIILIVDDIWNKVMTQASEISTATDQYWVYPKIAMGMPVWVFLCATGTTMI